MTIHDEGEGTTMTLSELALSELLDSLGKTPHEVAVTLKAAGVKGVPGDPRRCAIARHVTQALGVPHEVDRGACYDAADENGEFVELTRPLAGFVQGFDEGCYPELVDGVFVRAYNAS